jgi:hypothetical protein
MLRLHGARGDQVTEPKAYLSAQGPAGPWQVIAGGQSVAQGPYPLMVAYLRRHFPGVALMRWDPACGDFVPAEVTK